MPLYDDQMSAIVTTMVYHCATNVFLTNCVVFAAVDRAGKWEACSGPEVLVAGDTPENVWRCGSIAVHRFKPALAPVHHQFRATIHKSPIYITSR